MVGADAEDEDRFACLVPIVKAVLEKVGRSLRLETSVPMLSHPQPSASLFHHFCVIKDNEAWRTWIDLQVGNRSHSFPHGESPPSAIDDVILIGKRNLSCEVYNYGSLNHNYGAK